VTSWLREAETLAILNKWDEEEKIRYFSQRLRGEAAEWLEEYLRDYAGNDYEAWKQSIIERFQNESDIDQLKNTLHNLTQLPGQRTKSFISKIKSMFDDVYGKIASLSDNPSEETVDLSKSVKKMRDEKKRNILLNGLLPKIKEELWLRMTKDPGFDEVCDIALTAESIVINKEIHEEKKNKSVVAVVTTPQDLTKELAHKETEISLLRQQVNILMTTNKTTPDPQGKESETTVGVVNNYSNKSGNRRPSRPNSQVRFNDGQSRNRGNSFSQPQGTGPPTQTHKTKTESDSQGQADTITHEATTVRIPHTIQIQ
jgi:hypothetical protein